MVKGNSLGSVGENVQVKKPTPVNVQNKDVVVKINERTVDKIRSKSSSILCCVVTTILVGVGIGISIWYAVTEV